MYYFEKHKIYKTEKIVYKKMKNIEKLKKVCYNMLKWLLEKSKRLKFIQILEYMNKLFKENRILLLKNKRNKEED